MNRRERQSVRRALVPSFGGRAGLDRYRDQQVRRLVRHAYEKVPLYRRLFEKHGVKPDDVRSVADLARLPIVGKRDLQLAGPIERSARGVDPHELIERRTTGSTGEPLSIRRTWAEERCLGAFRWRTLHALGMRATDRHVDVEERAPADPRDDRSLHAALSRLGLYRQARIHALLEPEEIVAELDRFRPDVLTGYAGVLARAARRRAELGRSNHRPRFIGAHSDTMTAQMRSAIEDGFGARVYELYDSNEFNLMAWECPVTGAMHVRDDAIVLEVLCDGRPALTGETGEVVATALHSFAMPFLRYRIGDRAVQGAERCSCGDLASTVEGIEGRTFDYFPLADGRMLHPYEIISVLNRTAPWMLEYRLLQERRDLVSIGLVASTVPEPGAVERVRREVSALLGPRVELRIDPLEEPRARTAKLDVCRSLVASEYRAR